MQKVSFPVTYLTGVVCYAANCMLISEEPNIWVKEH